jgi:hypothetical protein
MVDFSHKQIWQVDHQQDHTEERYEAREPADRVSQSHDPEILIAHVADLVSQHAGKLAQG